MTCEFTLLFLLLSVSTALLACWPVAYRRSRLGLDHTHRDIAFIRALYMVYRDET